MTHFAPASRGLLAAVALLGAAGIGAAHAGTCPADKVVADGKGQAMSNLPASRSGSSTVCSGCAGW